MTKFFRILGLFNAIFAAVSQVAGTMAGASGADKKETARKIVDDALVFLPLTGLTVNQAKFAKAKDKLIDGVAELFNSLKEEEV